MSAVHGDDLYEAWRDSLSALTASVTALESWRERRFRFAHRTADLLTHASGGSPSVTGPVVYGVYLNGAGLVYIGQTQEAERRLRDLPVGESHHLANTIPPELWERVVVVHWPRLIRRTPSDEQKAIGSMGLVTCGLALEHLLQVEASPPVNGRRRTRTGEWRVRRLAGSRSRGAVHSPAIPELLRHTWDVWQELAVAPSVETGVTTLGDVGRVVFPSAFA